MSIKKKISTSFTSQITTEKLENLKKKKNYEKYYGETKLSVNSISHQLYKRKT